MNRALVVATAAPTDPLVTAHMRRVCLTTGAYAFQQIPAGWFGASVDEQGVDVHAWALCIAVTRKWIKSDRRGKALVILGGRLAGEEVESFGMHLRAIREYFERVLEDQILVLPFWLLKPARCWQFEGGWPGDLIKFLLYNGWQGSSDQMIAKLKTWDLDQSAVQLAISLLMSNRVIGQNARQQLILTQQA